MLKSAKIPLNHRTAVRMNQPSQPALTCVRLSSSLGNPSLPCMVLEFCYASGDDGREGGALSRNHPAALTPAASRT